MIQFIRATTDHHLEQILQLQKENLKENIPPKSRTTHGFVTAKHNFEQLKYINNGEKAIIAIDNNKVVGFALAMLEERGKGMPIFDSLFDTVSRLKFKEQYFSSYTIIYVGQLCVASSHSGRGLAQQIYHHFTEELKDDYDLIITDVSRSNPRSLNTHLKSGFSVVHTFYDSASDDEWYLVVKETKPQEQHFRHLTF